MHQHPLGPFNLEHPLYEPLTLSDPPTYLREAINDLLDQAFYAITELHPDPETLFPSPDAFDRAVERTARIFMVLN